MPFLGYFFAEGLMMSLKSFHAMGSKYPWMRQVTLWMALNSLCSYFATLIRNSRFGYIHLGFFMLG